MSVVGERVTLESTELTHCLQHLQSTHATGCLDIRSANGTRWRLHVFMGRMIWATGGSHPEQRWFRLVAQHLSHLDPTQLKQITRQAIGPSSYSVLLDLLKQQQLQRETAMTMVREVVEEVLFDLLYEEALFSLPGSRIPLDYSLDPEDRLENPISLLRTEDVCEKVTELLKRWHHCGLAGYSPNTAPVIQYPTLLQQQVSPEIFKLLSSYVNGKHSLRNLSLLMQQDLLDLAQLLHPLVTAKFIRLDYEQEQTSLANAPAPSEQPSRVAASPPAPKPSDPARVPMIACIDDSPIICQQLEHELTRAGFQFLGIQEPTKALPLMLRTVPDLIFLDLVMPITNGYELCAQIRRTRKLKDIPVVILTANTGLIFQARARMVGSTDYLTKPIQMDEINKILQRYIPL